MTSPFKVQVSSLSGTSLESIHIRVAVIGAGFAGIGTAIQLMRCNERSFLVLERGEEVGGTWRDNIYPGVGCDIPSHLYSFSFAPKPDWTHRYAEGFEIQQYLRDCANEPGVAERICYSTSLQSAHWDSTHARWELETSRGRITASVLVLGTGRFGRAQIPDIPGLSSFPGPVCHSSSWDNAINAGMRVAVVGSGASAIQIVPALACMGSTVLNIQRSAPWIIPKGNRPYSDAMRRSFEAADRIRAAHRQEIFEAADSGFAARILGSHEQVSLRKQALAHLHAHVHDPELRETLTPSYEIGCKRVLLSDDYYPALASGPVSLHQGVIDSIEEKNLTLSNGTTHTVDALVFATGFEASRPEIAMRIHGRDGLRLDEHWEHGMVSYGSTVVSGFPNLVLLGGPNGALGHNSALTIMESQISHLCSALDYLSEGWHSFEATSGAEKSYTAMIDERAAETVWLSGGCTSWYRHDRNGRLALLWPGTAQEYASKYSRFDPTKFYLEEVPTEPASVQVGLTLGEARAAGGQL